MASTPMRPIEQLPEEILQDILSHLDKHELSQLALVSRWAYTKAAPQIWREVDLVDGRTTYSDWDGHDGDDAESASEDGRLRRDEHDDSAIIKKLLVLASKPLLASYVHTLNHRCHLPPPSIFTELPCCSFTAQTVSSDPRTLRLAQMASRNMISLHTLRIIFGHPRLTEVLLRNLFDKTRRCDVPISNLWLESCSIGAGYDHVMGFDSDRDVDSVELDFSGLESVRLRRLPLHTEDNSGGYGLLKAYARSQHFRALQDGLGGIYSTSMNQVREERGLWRLESDLNNEEVEENMAAWHDSLFTLANQFDDKIYAMLDEDMTSEQRALVQERHVQRHLERSFVAQQDPLLVSGRPPPSVPLNPKVQVKRQEPSPAALAVSLLHSTSRTLTSLCFDWNALRTPQWDRARYTSQSGHEMFISLFRLRFPLLRSFQYRNAITEENRLPQGIFLLDLSEFTDHNVMSNSDGAEVDTQCEKAPDLGLLALEFMEAHSNLRCLAWPMEALFSGRPQSPDLSDRVERVIDSLGRTLTDLRVDALYSYNSDLVSERRDSPTSDIYEPRREFIARFPAKMTKLESIKIEGGIPRDERREILRALRACPASKLVIIGVFNPLGNTWGFQGQDFPGDLELPDRWALQAEHKAAIHELGVKALEPPEAVGTFEPEYGWLPGPPQLHNIASYFADTITELKMCGYQGSPCLFSPTPITDPMLHALKHFHKLQSLTMSLWLDTRFEGEARDAEIIGYWNDARQSTSTALVRLSDEEPEGWERELRTKFSPEALAWRVTNFFGQYLSDEARKRAEGVKVRASFCMGDSGTIFDIDVAVGYGLLGSRMLGYRGPRTEMDPERRKSKLQSRRWF